ncbi:MAG: AI-2E family transporter [Neisseria sp.]|nr:AI-2E family transporter [Neisseria sp.]
MYLKKKQGSRLAAAAAVAVLSVFLALLYALGNVLTPFVVAAVLAYILHPLVEWLEQHRFGRATSSLLVTLSALAVLLGLMLVMVPMLVTQFQNLTAKLPALVQFVQLKVLPWLAAHAGEGILPDKTELSAWLSEHIGMLQTAAGNLARAVLGQSGFVANTLSNVALLPLLLYYFLFDWNRWTEGVRKAVPRRFVKAYDRVGTEIDEVLSGFLRGQLTVMLIMGAIYGAGLALVGLDSGFAIGLIAGVLVFIPYLGAFIGLLLATLAAMLQFSSWQDWLWVWAVFGIGQLLESFVVTPKIVGDRIGLSPFWVIFSLMAFGRLLGFVGMLAGLPLAAVSLVLLREGAQLYFGSRFYRQRGK